MAKKKEKVITIKITEANLASKQWYTYCPSCGYTSACSDTQRLACSQCGHAALSLPCGSQIE